MIRLFLLFVLGICLVGSSGYYPRAAPHNGYEAEVNRNNALRQLQVNAIARNVGSGTGTARLDGVPGTPLGRTGRDKYSYGYHRSGHGYGRYAYAGRGYGGHVYRGHGHGRHSYGGQSYSRHSHGRHGYGGYGLRGRSGYGHRGFGSGNYGHGGHGNGRYGYNRHSYGYFSFQFNRKY